MIAAAVATDVVLEGGSGSYVIHSWRFWVILAVLGVYMSIALDENNGTGAPEDVARAIFYRQIQNNAQITIMKELLWLRYSSADHVLVDAHTDIQELQRFVDQMAREYG